MKRLFATSLIVVLTACLAYAAITASATRTQHVKGDKWGEARKGGVTITPNEAEFMRQYLRLSAESGTTAANQAEFMRRYRQLRSQSTITPNEAEFMRQYLRLSAVVESGRTEVVVNGRTLGITGSGPLVVETHG